MAGRIMLPANEPMPEPRNNNPISPAPAPSTSLAMAGTTCMWDMPKPPKAQVMMITVRTIGLFLM